MIRQKEKARRKSVPLFRVAGIHIFLDCSWFIIFALVTWSLSAGYFPRHFHGFGRLESWTAGTVTSILFFLSIVLHELVHSMVAMRMGIAIRSITLFIFGGSSHLSQETKSPMSEFLIACSGPLTNILLGVLLMAIKTRFPFESVSGYPVIAEVINYLAWINIFIGIFNLVPAFPLDGGRMLRAVVWWKTGSPSYAIGLSTDMGKGFSLAIIGLGAVQVFTGQLVGGLWLVLIGLFLRSAAYEGMEGFAISHAIDDIKVRDIMIGEWVSVPPDITVERLVAEYILNSGKREFPAGSPNYTMHNSECLVESGGIQLGTVSLENILSLSAEERKSTSVSDIMILVTEDSEVSPDDNIAEALRRMISSNINRLLVVESGKMIGMVTRNGMIRLMELRKR